MPNRAPRQTRRFWQWTMRGAMAIFAVAATAGGAPLHAEITGASYRQATDIYGHGAVPNGEYAGIEFTVDGKRVIGAALFGAVYEDTAPRLVDVTGDGHPEVITVVSYFDRGAALRIWGERPAQDHPVGSDMVVLAETAPIGKRHRWLAVIGAADLDGDGATEIAYIDRPHLAKTLRIVRFEERKGRAELVEVAAKRGLTNHQFGQTSIVGGIRECGGRPEIITLDAEWRNVMATQMGKGQLISRRIARYTGRTSISDITSCRE